ANEGYILFAFDTRGTAGRGRAWVNAVHKNSAEKPLQDLKIAADFLNQLPYVDGERLGIWGWSNGGYMTCCAMTMVPGVFRAGVAVAPVTNFQWYDTIYTERYMECPQDNPEGYKNSAPVNFADDLQGELMLVHGISDDNVHVQNTYRMVDRLIEAGKDYQLYLYPERKHGIGGSLRQAHLYHRMFEFFARTLKQN
ncbi:prolyl oligopeptidase family serine peptidase, partial [bacterium]|nr:prolyl oligopeptidase family serine peptidase [bacterium]